MGIVQQHLKNWAAAAENFQAALELLAESPSPWLKAKVINNLGISYFNIPDFDQAELHFQEALTQHRALGARRGVPSILTNLASIAFKRKQWQKALDFDQEALVLHQA